MDIEKHLAWLTVNVPASGRIYFYFGGHGAPDPSSGTSYLVPFDGDPQFLEQTGVPMASVAAALSRTKAREVVAVVDACFSGAGGRSVLPPGARPLVVVKQETASARLVLFSAASGAEISGPAADGRGGLFTRYVNQALGEGKADMDGDGQITARELAEWVRPRVVRDAQQQNRQQVPNLITPTDLDPTTVVLSWGLSPR